MSCIRSATTPPFRQTGGGQCAVCIRACSYKELPAVVLYWDGRAGGGRERDARRGDDPHDRGVDAWTVHTDGVQR